jgi:hypothetical protein
MKKVSKVIVIFLMVLLPFSVSIQSCDDVIDILDEILKVISETGWLQDQEEMDNIPDDITPFDDDGKELKPSIDLSNRFPPIGDQGQFGTCVAWSVGYNLKTALNAIEKGWKEQDLKSTSNQTSPKDLWLSIKTKGTKCNGTNF